MLMLKHGAFMDSSLSATCTSALNRSSWIIAKPSILGLYAPWRLRSRSRSRDRKKPKSEARLGVVVSRITTYPPFTSTLTGLKHIKQCTYVS